LRCSVVRHVLLIKLFDGFVVVKKPCLTQMLRLTLDKYQPTSIEVKVCTYRLVDDKCFNLWDACNLKFFRWNSDFRANYIISDQLYFISFINFCISVIGISVKSHISTSLMIIRHDVFTCMYFFTSFFGCNLPQWHRNQRSVVLLHS